MRCRFLHRVCLLPLATVAGATAPQDWPSFRGPNGSGTTDATGLPDTLDVEKNLAWRAEVPAGYSSPVVVGERLVCTGVQDGVCTTLCFDALTGEPLWTRTAPEPRHAWKEEFNTPASPTPASDGQRLYVLFPTFGMVAYDREGELLWARPMEKFSVPHGMSSSPVAVPGADPPVVLLQCDQDVGSHLLAMDGRTGETVWEAPRPGITHGYASPVLQLDTESAGIVLTNGAFRAVAYSLEDGEPIWWFDGMGWDTSILPLVDERAVYVGSNGPPILIEDVLFLVKDSIVTSLRTANGAVVKQGRAGGLGDSIASPVAADGKLYLASSAGVLTVLSATAEWAVLGQSELEEEVWATPAIACGAVYVRSKAALYCFREDG